MDSDHATTVAFGSCNKQTLPQDFWEKISKFQPSQFLWTGDAVYTKGRALDKLVDAYQNLTSNGLYSEFSNTVKIDGVWDDHDYGVNDGGKFVKNKQERVDEYVKFLTGSSDNRLRPGEDNIGVYHSTDVNLGDVTAKIIFLDTRYFRDNHYISSLGQYPIKGSAVVASFLRGLYITLGFGRQFSGEFLGEAQWGWLKQTLQSSTSDLNIIVSSVQVLTSNALFESWGHFPVEKRRLFDLLAETDPKNVVFLSGDVHLGEVSQAAYTREDGSTGQWIEITSSGLTHSCSEGLTGLFCPGVTALFSQHRRDQKSVYLKRNFGLIQATKQEYSADAVKSWNVEFSVRALPSAKAVLSHNVVIDKAQSSDVSAYPIVGVQYADFPQVPLAVLVLLFFVVAFVLRVMLFSYRKNQAYLKRQQKRH